MGTVGEIIGIPLYTISIVCYVTLLAIYDIPSDNSSNNSYIINKYKASDIGDAPFSAVEVTKLLNSYYNYTPSLNSEVYYNGIVDNFINHRYANAEVSTLDTASLFDIAALDTIKSIGETQDQGC